MIEITKDIPIPPAITKKKYPLDKMEVGDSFAVNVSQKPSIACAISRRHKNTSKKFTTRRVPEKEIRVWRVE